MKWKEYPWKTLLSGESLVLGSIKFYTNTIPVIKGTTYAVLIFFIIHMDLISICYWIRILRSIHISYKVTNWVWHLFTFFYFLSYLFLCQFSTFHKLLRKERPINLVHWYCVQTISEVLLYYLSMFVFYSNVL